MPLNYVQVEDRLFCVPRYEFVQSSEVFAGMFRLPSGPGAIIKGQDGANTEGQDGANTEGQDRKHPIVLEGYKKDEFACLLKVMYPTYVLKISILLNFTYLWACIQTRISDCRYSSRLAFGKGGVGECTEAVYNLEYGKGMPQ